MTQKILREFTGDRPTILTTATHERYQSLMGHLPYNFILWNYTGSKPWHENFAKIPDNHTYINNLTPDVKFDAVLCQNKFKDYDHLLRMSRNRRVPLIQLEHCVCRPDAPQSYIMNSLKRSGDVNVYITEYSAKMWKAKNYRVIPHMVDVDVFKPNFSSPKTNEVLSVVNDYKERNAECGFDVWQRNTQLVQTKLVGTSNCGLSTPAKDLTDLLSYYQSHKIFLNTSLVSPLPMSVLEAMACGLCVISTSTCDIPNVIQDGQNGFLFDPQEDISEQLKQLTEYNDKAFLKIGNRARQTVIDKFSKDNFVKNWCEVINSVL
jgi:hypothetical protein